MDTLLQLGTEYEIYVRNTIKTKYSNCWLWKDIPKEVLFDLGFINDIKNTCDDIGCDILAKKHDNTYEYIQCKNYSTLGIDNTINISDLSGFYNFVAENNISNVLVYYSGILSSQILCRKKKIKYINLPYIKISNVNIIPRDYQIEAFNILKDATRSILEMPCGTGKTLITYLISLNFDNIILISPLISTTEQLISHYKQYYSSETKIPSFNIIHSQATRKLENIKYNTGDKNIIGATFDSCDIVNKLLCKLQGSIFIIIDECHNLSNNMISIQDNEINKILTSSNKILFVSATPKNYGTEYQNIFGNTKYTLSWDDAISNKYICDYNFYYPNNDRIIDHIKNIKLDTSFIEKTVLINKAFFLLETIKTINITKCIVYLKTVKEANDFENVLKTINIYYNLKLALYNINYNTSRTTRNISLTKFRNNTTKICIILNVHILDEGIDIPECDSIFLTHPNNNPINIIQRISRANRIHNNKIKANVLVWSKTQQKLNDIVKRIETYIPVKFGNIQNKLINNLLVDNINKYNYNNDLNNDLNNSIINIFINTTIVFLFDDKNILWVVYNDLLNYIGYYYVKTQKNRFKLDKKYFISFNKLKIYKKYNFINTIQPITKMINLDGIMHLLNNSSKKQAKELLQSILKFK